MEIRLEKDAEEIGNPHQQLAGFGKEMENRQAEWVARLRDNPDEFVRIEEEVQEAFGKGGGRFLPALMVSACQDPDAADAPVCADSGRRRETKTVRVQLLCGLLLWGTTWYVAPPRRKATQFARFAIYSGPNRGSKSFDQSRTKGIEATGIEARLQNRASYRRAVGDTVVGVASAGVVGLARWQTGSGR